MAKKNLAKPLSIYKYDERLIAFVDILDFAGKVKASIKSPESLDRLCEALHFIKNYINEMHSDYVEPDILQITQFSDSIVMSVKMEDSREMVSVFQYLKNIQVNLIERGVLLRGGIVKGQLIHTNDMLVGPGMVNAYYLESKCAQYPRIVIDPKVLYQFVRSNGKKESFRIKKFDYHKTFSKDTDGTSYIDYFNDIDESLNNGYSEIYFEKLCRLIKDNIDSEDISVRMKYLWMREKLKTSEYFSEFEPIYRKVMKERKKKIS